MSRRHTGRGCRGPRRPRRCGEPEGAVSGLADGIARFPYGAGRGRALRGSARAAPLGPRAGRWWPSRGRHAVSRARRWPRGQAPQGHVRAGRERAVADEGLDSRASEGPGGAASAATRWERRGLRDSRSRTIRAGSRPRRAGPCEDAHLRVSERPIGVRVLWSRCRPPSSSKPRAGSRRSCGSHVPVPVPQRPRGTARSGPRSSRPTAGSRMGGGVRSRVPEDPRPRKWS